MNESAREPKPYSATASANLDAITRLLAGTHGPRRIGYELERILIDAAGATVPWEGAEGRPGVADLVAELAATLPGAEPQTIDGHLLGLSYTERTSREPVGVAVSVEPAAQLEVALGPAGSVAALHEAQLAFDEAVERALDVLGLNARLVAAGYNPAIDAPDELALIPKERYRDMDAHLAPRGRFARDMMRATASTQVSLDYGSEAEAARLVRMATILGPVLAHLFDNAPIFRGKPAPDMARSRIWHHVDGERCGIAPGSLADFSFERYARWVAGVRPILFTDEAHVTRATGDARALDIMGERALTQGELMHLLSMVFPNVRLKGFVELREMDSLPPRLAAACTSFAGALLYDAELEEKLAGRLAEWLPRGFAEADEADCLEARFELERLGWDARPYGVPEPELARVLVDIALENARGVDYAPEEDRAFDAEGITLLAEMWKRGELPRDRTAAELGLATE